MSFLFGELLTKRWHELVTASTTVDIAVAWITDCPALLPLYDLAATPGKRLRVVVGVHDYLTSAEVLRRLHQYRAVKIGVAVGDFKFHPKFYRFMRDEQSICWVGSANLTGHGFGGNIELVHEFAARDADVGDWFEDLWGKCERPNAGWLQRYEEKHHAVSSNRIPLTQMPAPQAPEFASEPERAGGPCYRTVKLARYSQPLMGRAEALRVRVAERIQKGRVFWREGSLSVQLSGSREVVAKVLIYEADLCRPVGGWPELPDGVYVLIRTDGVSSDAIWTRHRTELASLGMRRDLTVGLDPNCRKRFAYHRLAMTENLEGIATLLADCTNLS